MDTNAVFAALQAARVDPFLRHEWRGPWSLELMDVHRVPPTHCSLSSLPQHRPPPPSPSLPVGVYKYSF